MGKLGILSLMFCTIVLLSCGKKKNVYSELEAFIGKEIIFSDKNFNTVGNKAFKDQFLLISYVDSGNCTPCRLEKTQYMKTNKRRLLDTHTGVLMIVHEKDTFTVNEVFRQMHVSYPIFFDSLGCFKKENGIFDNPLYQDFVIDRSNKVVWLGNPLRNKQSWQQYEKAISMLMDSGK